MSLPDAATFTPTDTLPIPGHPAWCTSCDIGTSTPADPAERARTIALIQHDSGAGPLPTFTREDRIVIDEAGALSLVVGEVRAFITEDGPSVSLDEARATALAILAALDDLPGQ